MAKIADRYFEIDPWKVIEKGSDPAYSEVAESIFSLGNEYAGVRGYHEEGTTAETLLGSYFNGIYENGRHLNRVQYKGIVQRIHFMVNTVDWLYTRISLDGEQVTIGESQITDFKRELDLRSGILTKEYVVTLTSGKKVKLHFSRFLHMNQVENMFQEISVTPLDGTTKLELTLGADFATKHFGDDYRYWQILDKGDLEAGAAILGETKTTKQTLLAAFTLDTSTQPDQVEPLSEEYFVGKKLIINLPAGETFRVRRHAVNVAKKTGAGSEDWLAGLRVFEQSQQLTWEQAVVTQRAYWNQVWENQDIVIVGDEAQQQGIRFCIFQLNQTYHGQDPRNNIGAKGLTGEAYSGHAFWDTETCCLPYYLLTNLEAAKNLLEFRYHTLEQARGRAKELDCQGACYPIATLNGHESSDLWQHASLQFQPSSGVAFAVWHYSKFADDKEFLYRHGLEMVLEISRFMVSRGDWDQNHENFGLWSVMGPDEFQMMVNHNTYTNLMAKFCIDYARELLAEVKDNSPEDYQLALAKTGVTAEELAEWQEISDHMKIIQTEAGLFEQHEGFFQLPHVDIHQIPVEEFPLYHHWSYDRIYRNDMIKQPDVLMFLFLLNQHFTKAVKRVNYEFYEPKTIHESSLSPAIHSILAAELGKEADAFAFFEFATRMDLDNYNRNTREGLHTTSIAGAWMNIVYGFGGIRTDVTELVMAPMIPNDWEAYSFHVHYKGAHLFTTVTKTGYTIEMMGQSALSILLHEKKVLLKAGKNDFIWEASLDLDR